MTKDQHIQSYQLLDAGDEEKLEALGPFRVTRQAAQAYWPKSKGADAWSNASARHHRSRSGGGHWSFQENLPKTWRVRWGGLVFTIKLTDFGHIGLFPEQRDNWQWLDETLAGSSARVLNLFGYTGGSSLAAAKAGAEVTHVDASRGAVTWARENQAANDMDSLPIRWVVEDVQRYLQREHRRGSHYQGVILDPPSFGRGPRGQVWKIEEHLNQLLLDIKQVMPDPRFVILSCHTPGFTGITLRNALHAVFGFSMSDIECGEMVVPFADPQWALPSGTFARWRG